MGNGWLGLMSRLTRQGESRCANLTCVIKAYMGNEFCIIAIVVGNG